MNVSTSSPFSRLAMAAIVATLIAGPIGCASSTQITSDPSGAQVLVDGSPVGNTPVVYNEGSVWVWTSHQVTLKKAGYQTTTGMIEATISPTHLILGILCCLPLVLVGQYKPGAHFVLQQRAAVRVMDALTDTMKVDFRE